MVTAGTVPGYDLDPHPITTRVYMEKKMDVTRNDLLVKYYLNSRYFRCFDLFEPPPPWINLISFVFLNNLNVLIYS